ncbi:hypothetical protein CFC21_101133 [Triticum aestivum]|uniref:NB-ARC domain-containing protein n=2 Tax=Triticum aestivum TaxID=4565 RepID=A0A3B6SD62_WHEAT|nr:disease resistance protein Pik-2-like [Triticum aestivum]KAF7099507.1 hypothetical protein CFC21_101133 [Triticum aestivum]
MAEFALGLTKTAVEGTLIRVKSAIEEEAKLKVRVQHDLVFITGEFQMMQSFLNIANTERAKNEVVQTWVRQIRDLAFDVEDCVEFVVHLDNRSTWSWLWRVLPSCMAPPLPLDLAVAEIKQLKARVEDVSQRNTRYNLITDSGSSSSKPEVSLPVVVPPATTGSAFHILNEVWDAMGKRRGMGDLTTLIMSEDTGLLVISVWGSSTGGADLGKTSIFRKAYCDLEICKEFKNRAWVKLVDPFDPDEFLKNVLAQFFPTSHQPNNADHVDFRKMMKEAVVKEDNLMKAELMQQVSDEQRYLIIIEELSDVVQWDAIKMCLPESNNGSRIVVATHDLRIALLCTGKPYQVWDLKHFSDGQSLCAFSLKTPESVEGKHSCSSGRTEELHDRVEKYHVYRGIDEHKCLMGCLGNSGVTSMWGIAGVGKTHFARLGYDEMRHSSKFMKYIWVDMPYPFSLTEFSIHLLSDFHSYDLEAKESAAIGVIEGQDPIQECCKILREEKCFLVIDGVRSTYDWDLIKGAFLTDPTQNNNTIVVITNEASIAMHCTPEKDKVINIKCFNAGKARMLFTKVNCERILLTPELTKVSNIIVTKCGGLPKVVLAAASKCFIPISRYDVLDHMEHMKADFMDILETDPTLNSLFSWMRSYFDACSDSVKPCIFYLSVFPADQDVRRRRLLRRWIAEGYSRDKFGNTAEEYGEILFSELVKLSIIHQEENKVLCQVNGFFREYIISRPMEENLVFALEGRCSPNSQHTGQHLVVRSSWDRDITVFESIDFSRLRSLTVFGAWKSFFISTNMRLLRVLDLENTSDLTDDDINKIDKLPPRLKFLSLRGCTNVSRLPILLGGLRQLQTLDVRYTSIVTLPPFIIKLQKLQYIRAGTKDMVEEVALGGDDDSSTSTVPPEVDGIGTVTINNPPTSAGVIEISTSSSKRRPARTLVSSWLSKLRRRKLHNGGVEIPVGIEKLTALHNLGVVRVKGAHGKAILEELKKLTQLRKLGVSGINRDNWQELCCAISGHGHLESLSVQLGEDEEEAGDFLVCLPKTLNLKSLKILGGQCQIPAWVKQQDNFKKIENFDLELTVSTQAHMDLIEELPCKKFRRLRVKPTQDGELHFGNPALYGEWDAFVPFTEPLDFKVIKIDCRYRLEVTFAPWLPLYVKSLKVQCSSGSSLRLSGLHRLWGLKEVWLTGSYGDELKQELQQEIAVHQHKPVLKLEKQRS